MTERPKIPAKLKREVLIEAGHRCAIPTCKQAPVDIAHIVPWNDCQDHQFENLIALCPTCHRRYDSGEIDRKSMKAYKQNLSLLNGRYSSFEIRVLRKFAIEDKQYALWLPESLNILIWYLREDKLIEDTTGTRWMGEIGGLGMNRRYQLTDKGRELIETWKHANLIK
jgi:hypothetical protein